jgi:hypothetical protein
MNDKCGLVHRANPCRCAKKTRGFMQAGVDDQPAVRPRARRTVEDVVRTKAKALSVVDQQYAGSSAGILSTSPPTSYRRSEHADTASRLRPGQRHRVRGGQRGPRRFMPPAGDVQESLNGEPQERAEGGEGGGFTPADEDDDGRYG